MYAVVRTGGRDWKVMTGDSVRVPKLDAKVGELIDLKEVKMCVREGNVMVAPEELEKAKVVAEVVGHGQDKKVTVFKKKRRKGYTRKRGHRQEYTDLLIREIEC